MADPFKPKFVDLVRNFTATTGTGNIVLGAAVAGHTGLASAVAVGEQFFYCIMGIDKPAEREIGRGMLTANGTVARTPAGGTPTNFTSGTKTIALVVAADWFGNMASWINGGADSLSALATSDKSSLVAAVNELAASGGNGGGGGGSGGSIGIGLLFTQAAGVALATSVTAVDTSGYASAGKGGARYVYDAAVNAAFVSANPRTAFLAGDGRGFRLDPSQRLNFMMFGAAGDYNPVSPGVLGTNYHDDRPAFLAMLAYLNGVAKQTSGNGSYRQAPTVYFPGAAHFISDAVDLFEASYDFRGVGRAGSTSGTTFYFAPGKDGFRLQWVNTSGKSATGSFTSTAGGSNFENIHLWSLGNAASDTGSGGAFQQDGFTVRASVTMTRCTANNFSRDGFAINATVGGAMQGNANGCVLNDCGAFRNFGKGISVNGGDANGCSFNRFSAYYNGYAGIHDNSFLGNAWNGPEEGDNGGVGAGPTWGNTTAGSFCRFDAGDGAGLYIWQVKRGQAAAASTTAPSNVAGNPWKRLVLGYVNALYPPWVSGTAFIDGASYIFENSSSASVISGGYTEGTSPAPSIAGPTIVVGGVLAAAVENGPGLRSQSSYLSSGMGFQQATHARGRTDGSVIINRFGTQSPASGDNDLLYTADGIYTDAASPGSPTAGFKLGWDASTRNLQWKDSFTGAVVSQITGRYTTYQFGRGSAQAAWLHSNRFMLGNGNTARELGSATSIPTSGTYAQGDFIRNTTGSVSGGAVVLGWYRLTDGSAHVTGTDWHPCVVPNAAASSGAGLSNGDKGDVVVASNGASLTVESATPAGGVFQVTGVIQGTSGISGTQIVVGTGTINTQLDVNGPLNIMGASGGFYIASRSSGSGWTQYVSAGVLAFNQGGNVFEFSSGALNLATGVVLKINGTQVVGPRGAAVAADATDLTSAIALVNDLKARLRTHGLIA